MEHFCRRGHAPEHDRQHGLAAALQAKVVDSSNNPVIGVTVTFTNPSSGASATFSGSATATAVTDANGIATAGVNG